MQHWHCVCLGTSLYLPQSSLANTRKRSATWSYSKSLSVDSDLIKPGDSTDAYYIEAHYWTYSNHRHQHNAVCEEIRKSRIETPVSNWIHSRRRHTYGPSRSIHSAVDPRVDHLYVPLKDSPEKGELVLMTGWLYKTNRLKDSKMRGHSRQHRRFRLTLHSLEYNHLLQTVSSKLFE